MKCWDHARDYAKVSLRIVSFSSFFFGQYHDRGWWKWQVDFQYLLHQFVYRFSSIEFEFSSSCMQFYSIFSFPNYDTWIPQKSTHFLSSFIITGSAQPHGAPSEIKCVLLGTNWELGFHYHMHQVLVLMADEGFRV